MKIDLSCPLEVDIARLPNKESENICLCLHNIGKANVSAALVAFLCTSKNSKQLLRQIEKLDFGEIKPKDSLEMELPIEEGSKFSSFDVTLLKVFASNALSWQRDEKNFIEYQSNSIAAGKKLDILREFAGDDAKGFPQDQGVLWLCVCGKPNLQEENACWFCSREKHEIFTKFNQAKIEQELKLVEAQEEERQRAEMEEALRIEQEKKDAENKKRRKIRTKISIAASLVILAGSAYGVYFHALPNYHYNQAKHILNLGNYEEAKRAFADLKTYKDSETMVLEADYLLAKSLVKSATVTSLRNAEELFSALGTYKDSASELLETKLLYADKVFLSGDFEAALSLYKRLDDKRAVEKIKELQYKWAQDMMQKLEYETAREKFAALGAYKNAAHLADECLYLPAVNALEEKNFEKAIVLFGRLPHRQDAILKIPESFYIWGEMLFEEGDYTQAAEKFLAAGAYRDAYRRATECLYKPAVEKMANKEYEQAKAMFDKIPEFEDAKQMSLKCSLELGRKEMEDGDYAQAVLHLKEADSIEEARLLLKKTYYLLGQANEQKNDFLKAAEAYLLARDYEDADKKAKETSYLAAEQALASGEYSNAISLFLQLQEYKDSKNKASEAMYKRAQTSLDKGEYENAIQQFSALGKYADSEKMQKEALLRLAKKDFGEGRLDIAKERFLALGDFADAKENYNETVYIQAKEAIANKDINLASELLMKIQGFKDATDLFLDFSYQAAKASLEKGDLLHASELFASLGDYLDAKELAQQTKLRFTESSDRGARDAYNRKEYEKVIHILENVNIDEMDKMYPGIKDLHYDAIYRFADELYTSDKPYEAYAYYKRISGYKDVKSKKMNRYPYLLFGSWKSTKGTMMHFYEDGSCEIDGEKLYYIAGRYRLLTGETPDTLTFTHNIVQVKKNSLTLKNEKTKRTYKMKKQ